MNASMKPRCQDMTSRQRQQPPQITVRPAAVLLLLTDGPDGPAVLLTERAPDLAHYPGQLVFPGGAADPGDDGPAATALREAAEEVGLDPGSVQILGALPAVALPDSNFLMTPVLAWSGRPVFTGSANLAEVSALTTIALRRLPHPHPGPRTAAVPFGAVTLMVIGLLKQMLTHDQAPSTADALTPVSALPTGQQR